MELLRRVLVAKLMISENMDFPENIFSLMHKCIQKRMMTFRLSLRVFFR